jgi:hypothetical protein
MTCNCCSGIEPATPMPEGNPPGLSAIRYRVGTYATFYETMLARLSSLHLDVPSAHGTGTDRIYPLSRLTTREPNDPAIALLDAWAIVGDVLAFYQERIANEGYLPTAIERRSLLELARLTGYRVRPGVSASVYLAFTTASGFAGEIPAGTRAQSIPGTGESPQFFETSDALAARDAWNALKARLTEPQLITPPHDPKDPTAFPTDADVIDTIYFDGIATNLKVNDALLVVLGAGAIPQWMRLVEAVDAQADLKRTQVTLVQALRSNIDVLKLCIDKAALFAASRIAQQIADVLTTLKNNLNANSSASAEQIAGAVAQMAAQRDIAESRSFHRLSAYIEHTIAAVQALSPAETQGNAPLTFTPPALAAWPLANLLAIAAPLARPPSVQPANPLQLSRSVRQSFAPESDVAPRLIAAFKPQAADTLYQAWTKVARAPSRLEIHALRTKAALFASNYPGPATVTSGATITPSFDTPPSIRPAWRDLLVTTPFQGAAIAVPPVPVAPNAVALDSIYDQIKPGSWVVINRPALTAKNNPSGDRVVTYHKVTATRAATMDTHTGFAAKVTLLGLKPQWLKDLTGTGLSDVLDTPAVLRDTIVYAQSEPLALTEAPLDTDVAGDTIALDDVYDGLEAGRWVIVSGTRTDIPNVTGVAANELVMLASIAQGAQAPMSLDFPAGVVPFTAIAYTTSANAAGDRLVVGTIDPAFQTALFGNVSILALPTFPNQLYSEQVELATGFFANAYAPTQSERNGDFPDFAGLLVDPTTGIPFPGGSIASALKEAGLFAWRISAQKLHTIVKLANALAYQYDAASLTVYGNVTKATHGQIVGEVLGGGDGSKAFQTFALRQAPLTYVSAPTPDGTDSTLTVRVNEVAWQETDNLAGAGPRDRAFIARTDDADKTSVVFGNGVHGARLPTGTANVKATYRYGIGQSGNVKAGQVSQLATHPLGVQAVINPLRASGGADRDSVDDARRNAPLAVMALDRLVSVEDYADFSRTYAGIAKASAQLLSDGRRRLVHVTIAGAHDIPIDPTSDLYRNLVTSLEAFGDVHLPIQVCPRRLKLLVISAGVQILPDYLWEAVGPKIRAAMLDHFGFDARELGQSAFQSEAVAVIQNAEGVAYVDMRVFDSVAENVDAGTLSGLGRKLALNPFVRAELAALAAPGASDPCERIPGAELVILTPDIPDVLILNQIGAKP